MYMEQGAHKKIVVHNGRSGFYLKKQVFDCFVNTMVI